MSAYLPESFAALTSDPLRRCKVPLVSPVTRDLRRLLFLVLLALRIRTGQKNRKRAKQGFLYLAMGSSVGCARRNSSSVSLGTETCSPFLVAATAVPAPAPASAPMPAPFPPPAMPPMSAPSPAPPTTFLAVFPPSPLPLTSYSLVIRGYEVPLMTMLVSSRVSWELPLNLPAEDACARTP